MSSSTMLLLAATVVLFAQAQPGTSRDLESRERELNALLQARLQNYQGERTVENARSFLGRGDSEDAQAPATTTAQSLNIPMAGNQIPQTFWNDASKILNSAGVSTPIPSAAFVNAPPKPPTPMPWQAVMEEPDQPLDTKLGGAMMYGLSAKVTPTPPPKQAQVSQQFIAQCPMVLFDKTISVRAGSCGEKLGQWVDPSPLNTRPVLRWQPQPQSGIHFGVDSALTGKGSGLFADIAQRLTLTGYHFVMKNCLGIERWFIEEGVYKIDDMGRVQSTLELHDVTLNSAAYFIKYTIKKPTGIVAAESTLFRMGSSNISFYEMNNGVNTGKVLGIATRQGIWTKKGWQDCMAPTSPRGWTIVFPQEKKDHESPATVQDIRVAISGTITLMGYRDENRAADGLNTQGAAGEVAEFIGALVMICVVSLLSVNCCLVFRSSGLRDKLKGSLFNSQGALLPARPPNQRDAPLHPTW